jgi:hypothetical protein
MPTAGVGQQRVVPVTCTSSVVYMNVALGVSRPAIKEGSGRLRNPQGLLCGGFEGTPTRHQHRSFCFPREVVVSTMTAASIPPNYL